MIRPPFTRTPAQEAEFRQVITDALLDFGDAVINLGETVRWSIGLELPDASSVARAEASLSPMAKAVVYGKATFYELGSIDISEMCFKPSSVENR